MCAAKGAQPGGSTPDLASSPLVLTWVNQEEAADDCVVVRAVMQNVPPMLHRSIPDLASSPQVLTCTSP
eukprot:1136946-Pelagomonas_calceolata.AAC.4